MARGKLLLLLLLLSSLVVDLALSCGRDACQLNRVRGCGNAGVQPEKAGLMHMCHLPPTVEATSFTDIRRQVDSYLILVEMPGVESDVQVGLEQSGRILSIAGVSRELQSDWRLVRNDRGSPTKLFTRKFVLPHHVDADRISHRLEQGLLQVRLPILPSSSSSVEEQTQVEAPEVEPNVVVSNHVRVTIPWGDCSNIQPEALVDHQPLPVCDNDLVTIPALVDVRDRPGSYEVVAEMPGVRSAEVTVDGDGVVSVAGLVEEAGDGQAVRIERGGGGAGSRKVFVRRFFFGSKTMERPVNSTVYNQQVGDDGLLRVTLRKAVPTLWDRVVRVMRRTEYMSWSEALQEWWRL